MTRGAWIGLFLLGVLAVAIFSTFSPTYKASVDLQRASTGHAPPAPAEAPMPVKRTPKEDKAWEKRNIDRAALEQTFLQAGLDVVVGNMGNQGSDDNRSLVIKGEPVNRPLVYNFLNREARSLLKKDGFTKVTFMRHSIGDWIAEYNPQTDKLTWD